MDTTVGVIIPALNEEQWIGLAVESCLSARADEVWVVDGQSEDQTIQRAAAAGAQVLQTAAGRAKQMNVGARHCGCQVLLFLHADCRLAGTAIDEVRRVANEGRPLFGAFRQRIDAAGLLFRWLEWGNAKRVTWWGLPLGDQAIFVSKGVFEDVGGYPEEPLLEDWLLSRRVRRLCRPVLLDGPVWVSARRWIRHGPVRQTLRNWLILGAWACGVSPQSLARLYRRHDR